MPTTIGMAATISILLQAIGLAAHWLKKPSEKPRMMPTAVTEPLRKFVIDALVCVLALRIFGHVAGSPGDMEQANSQGSVFHRQMPVPIVCR